MKNVKIIGTENTYEAVLKPKKNGYDLIVDGLTVDEIIRSEVHKEKWVVPHIGYEVEFESVDKAWEAIRRDEDWEYID